MASLAMVPISIVAHERQRGQTEIALVANNFADGTELFVVLIPNLRANSWIEYKFFDKCMKAVISSLREANLLTSPPQTIKSHKLPNDLPANISYIRRLRRQAKKLPDTQPF